MCMCVRVRVLVFASCLQVHLHLYVCTLCPCIHFSVCVSCCVHGGVFTSAYIVFPYKHIYSGLYVWDPCWAACAPLFSGLPPPFPEPQIVLHPYDIWNVTGKDVIFGCEVFAYPMASIEWRKDGLDIQLPGDDPHISVQVGLPQGQPRAQLEGPC